MRLQEGSHVQASRPSDRAGHCVGNRFLLGAGLAVCIAPGDIALWAAAGLVLSIFCRAFLIGDLGGISSGPSPMRKKTHPKPNDKLGPTATQH